MGLGSSGVLQKFDVTYSVGLVVPQREPMTPLIAALAQIAREVAPTLEA